MLWVIRFDHLSGACRDRRIRADLRVGDHKRGQPILAEGEASGRRQTPPSHAKPRWVGAVRLSASSDRLANWSAAESASTDGSAPSPAPSNRPCAEANHAEARSRAPTAPRDRPEQACESAHRSPRTAQDPKEHTAAASLWRSRERITGSTSRFLTSTQASSTTGGHSGRAERGHGPKPAAAHAANATKERTSCPP